MYFNLVSEKVRKVKSTENVSTLKLSKQLLKCKCNCHNGSLEYSLALIASSRIMLLKILLKGKCDYAVTTTKGLMQQIGFRININNDPISTREF